MKRYTTRAWPSYRTEADTLAAARLPAEWSGDTRVLVNAGRKLRIRIGRELWRISCHAHVGPSGSSIRMDIYGHPRSKLTASAKRRALLAERIRELGIAGDWLHGVCGEGWVWFWTRVMTAESVQRDIDEVDALLTRVVERGISLAGVRPSGAKPLKRIRASPQQRQLESRRARWRRRRI